MNPAHYRILSLGAAFVGVFHSVAASAQSTAGDDIIVTAQRVEQRLQDVPISITVLDQEDLKKRNIAVATDLATYTPSLSVNQRYGPEKASFGIRGFTQNQSTAPTVGVYFAEVVGVRAQGGTTSGNTVGPGAFTDLENVQVLKGPQGTLFGRNTTGGAVLLTPKKPTDDFEGYVEGTYGNYAQVRLQGALNIPLAETFKVRLVAERNTRDGHMRNVSGVGPENYNDVDYVYARLGIVGELTPDLENYTLFHYSKSSTNGYATRITGCDVPVAQGGTLNVVKGSPGYSGTRHLQAASCAIQLARQNARGDSFYEVDSANANPFLDIEQWQVINTTTWRASDTITVKNIVSYGEFRERANFDLGSSNFEVPLVDNYPAIPNLPASSPFLDGFDLTRINPALVTPTGLPLYATAGLPYQRIVLDTASPDGNNSAQSTFTEELQVQISSADNRFSGVIGGYLEFSRPLRTGAGRTGIFLNCARPQDLDCTNPLLFGSISEDRTRYSFDNHGIFAQGTYDLTDKLAITGGIRWTFDKVDGVAQGTRASIVATGTPGSFVDPVSGRTARRRCTDSFRHAAVTPGLDTSGCRTELSTSSNEPTWVVNLEYQPNYDLLFYTKYARGYRQGGMSFTNPGLEIWNPEKLDSYEVGAKTSFRGAVSGYFNFAAFYNDLTNQQFFAGLLPTPQAAADGVSGGATIVNAGSSRVFGIEVDASVRLFDSLRLTAAYTYLDTKVKAVEAAATQGDGSRLGQLLVDTPFGMISPRVQVGSPFNDSPKHKLSATATYTLPLDDSIGDVSFGATWVYSSSYINDGAAPATVGGQFLGVTPSTNLLNLNFDWKSVAGSSFDLALFATNVTKERFNVASTGAWASAGVAEVTWNQPCFYGIRVRYNFGAI